MQAININKAERKYLDIMMDLYNIKDESQWEYYAEEISDKLSANIRLHRRNLKSIGSVYNILRKIAELLEDNEWEDAYKSGKRLHAQYKDYWKTNPDVLTSDFNLTGILGSYLDVVLEGTILRRQQGVV